MLPCSHAEVVRAKPRSEVPPRYDRGGTTDDDAASPDDTAAPFPARGGGGSVRAPVARTAPRGRGVRRGRGPAHRLEVLDVAEVRGLVSRRSGCVRHRGGCCGGYRGWRFQLAAALAAWDLRPTGTVARSVGTSASERRGQRRARLVRLSCRGAPGRCVGGSRVGGVRTRRRGLGASGWGRRGLGWHCGGRGRGGVRAAAERRYVVGRGDGARSARGPASVTLRVARPARGARARGRRWRWAARGPARADTAQGVLRGAAARGRTGAGLTPSAPLAAPGLRQTAATAARAAVRRAVAAARLGSPGSGGRGGGRLPRCCFQPQPGRRWRRSHIWPWGHCGRSVVMVSLWGHGVGLWSPWSRVAGIAGLWGHVWWTLELFRSRGLCNDVIVGPFAASRASWGRSRVMWDAPESASPSPLLAFGGGRRKASGSRSAAGPRAEALRKAAGAKVRRQHFWVKGFCSAPCRVCLGVILG